MRQAITLYCIVFLLIPRLEAQPRGAAVTNTSPAASGKTYALVVGISNYKELPKLQYADADAAVFAAFLKKNVADTANIKLITNGEANKVNILSELVKIKKAAAKGDRVYIYFAGHGDIETEITNGGVLLLYDSYKENYYLNSNGILHQDELKSMVTQMVQKEAQVFLITDACHSGSLSGGQGGAEKNILALKEAWGGETKIFSCQANEVSMEGKQWGNGRGLFSFHLVEGLTGLADEEGDNDGQVSLFELQSYLQKNVRKQAAPNKQTPFVTGNLDNNVTAVNTALLASLKESKAGNYPLFASAGGRGTTPPITDQTNYTNFKNALAAGKLLEPDKNNAWYFYSLLAKTIADANTRDQLQRDLISGLLNGTNNIINPLLSGTVSYTTSTAVAQAIKQAAKAIELLGADHYLANNFKARKLFLEAVLLTLEDEKNTANINGAIAKLNESVKLEPFAYYAYFQLGYLYNLQKNSPKAIENYNRYLSYLPKDADAINNVGVSFYNQGSFDKALEYYTQSIALKPTAKAYTNIALAYYKNKQTDKVQPALDKATQLDPKYFTAYYLLGKAYTEDKLYDKALLQLNKALAISPQHAATLYYCAMAQLGKKDSAKALPLLDKAIAADGNYSDAYALRASLLYQQKQYSRAAADYKAAMALNPKLWDSYLYLGKSYVQLNQYQQAIDAWESAIMVDRNLVKVLSLEIGNIYRDQLRKYERANSYYQKYMELNPMDAKGYAESGLNFMYMKNMAAADQNIKKAAALAPKDAVVKQYQQLYSTGGPKQP